MIQFRCPNGHKIHCPDDWAGRAAKCPKCGAKFRIPQPSASEKLSSESEALRLAQESSTAAQAPDIVTVDRGPVTGPNQIEFLCPNGHHLHCPKELQGLPGKCPQCGIKFRIPSYEEGETGAADSAVEPQASSSVTGLSWFEEQIGSPNPIEFVGATNSARAAASDQWQPVGKAFVQLWQARQPGTKFVLSLNNGHELVPSDFDLAHSTARLGVFRIRQDGQNSIVIVPWEAITAIRIAGMGRLPGKLGK